MSKRGVDRVGATTQWWQWDAPTTVRKDEEEKGKVKFLPQTQSLSSMSNWGGGKKTIGEIWTNAHGEPLPLERNERNEKKKFICIHSLLLFVLLLHHFLYSLFSLLHFLDVSVHLYNVHARELDGENHMSIDARTSALLLCSYRLSFCSDPRVQLCQERAESDSVWVTFHYRMSICVHKDQLIRYDGREGYEGDAGI